MTILPTDKIANHRCQYKGNYKQSSYFKLFLGPNPLGPQGGSCGNAANARCIAEGPGAWVSHMQSILQGLMLGITEPIEVDLAEIETRARYESRMGMGTWLVKNCPQDQLLSLLHDERLGERAKTMLAARIKKG